jgi:parallel beta-helix repeat protein
MRRSRIWVLLMVLTVAFVFSEPTVLVALGDKSRPTVVSAPPKPTAGPIGTRLPDLLPPSPTRPLPTPSVSRPEATNTLRITDRTPTAITLKWHDRSDVEDGNKLFRHTSWESFDRNAVEIRDLGPLNTPNGWVEYTDTTVSPDARYCYQVRPYNVYGTSNSNIVCDEILQPATEENPEIYVYNDLNLAEDTVVTKRIILEGSDASGVTINCNGATLYGGEGNRINYGKPMIAVGSIQIGKLKWQRPENITIKNCNIIGSVHVYGMWGPDGRDSARTSGHTARARNNAPRNIVFDNVTISAVGGTGTDLPLYLFPGVTYVQLVNSEIKGNTRALAIYLDAESCCNTIKNNDIHVTTSRREVMAIDGSSHNKIMNNTFSGLDHGGIYLYRNCGDNGVSRHSTPSHNMIINNIFYYDKYTGGNPSVYLGSRDGDGSLCDKDSDSDYGSGVSDLDYARHNIVMQNQIYKRSISDMIKTRNPAVNSPNYIGYNQTVTAETVVNNRRAGCFVPDGYQKDFILHGESVDVFKIRDVNGQATCDGYKYFCNDGDLRSFPTFPTSPCEVSKASFDCPVTGNNDGCQKVASCPTGERIVGAVAACNLEYGTISDGILATVPVNTIKVIRESDHVSEGLCFVGRNNLQDGNSLQIGQRTITGINGQPSVRVSCKEHDENGGDCHIKGTLYCWEPFTEKASFE